MTSLRFSVVCYVTWTYFFTQIPANFGISQQNKHRTRRATYTEQAINRLSEVFGIEQVPTLIYSRSPPEYMTELYNSVAFSDGISKRSTPYDASIVRGFPDRATSHQTDYHFNVSSVPKMEGVLAAELRLYRTHPARRLTEILRPIPRANMIQVQVYQVLSRSPASNQESLRLIDSLMMNSQSTGWQTFTVTDAIKQWINDSNSNLGFMVRATSQDGQMINDTELRFAQRSQHHDSKQPVLVVYSGDTASEYYTVNKRNGQAPLSTYQEGNYSTNERELENLRNQYIKSLNEGYQPPEGGEFQYERQRRFMTEQQHEILTRSRQYQGDSGFREARRFPRSRRSYNENKRSGSRKNSDHYRYPSRRKQKGCQRGELYVDFDEIGWSGWIISPKGYNAFHCFGECPFPLGQFHRPTNHATVQSIVHTMRVDKDVEMPCCVPDKLFSISLLYFDDEENVILKQYDEMVAASCGCH